MPVLEEIAEALKSKGHDAYVTPQKTSCKIEVFPKSASRSGSDRPFLTFHVGEDEVHVSGSNMLPGRGGSSGPRGSISRADFSSESVQEQTMSWLREVFEGPWTKYE